MQDITSLLPPHISWAISQPESRVDPVLTLTDTHRDKHVDVNAGSHLDYLGLEELGARVIGPCLAALERRA